MTRCNGYWARGSGSGVWYSECGQHRLHRRQATPRKRPTWLLETLIRDVPVWQPIDTFSTMQAAKDAAERGTL